MVFSSPWFLAFLVATLVWLKLPWSLELKKRWLALASCFFYAAWDWRYLGLLLFISSVDYYCAARVAASDDLVVAQPQYVVDELRGARRFGYARLPRKMERPQHDPRRVGAQFLAENTERRLIRSAIEHGWSRDPLWRPRPRIGWPSRDRQDEKPAPTPPRHSC